MAGMFQENMLYGRVSFEVFLLSGKKKKKIMGNTLISPGTRRAWPYGLKAAVKEMKPVL